MRRLVDLFSVGFGVAATHCGSFRYSPTERRCRRVETQAFAAKSFRRRFSDLAQGADRAGRSTQSDKKVAHPRRIFHQQMQRVRLRHPHRLHPPRRQPGTRQFVAAVSPGHPAVSRSQGNCSSISRIAARMPGPSPAASNLRMRDTCCRSIVPSISATASPCSHRRRSRRSPDPADLARPANCHPPPVQSLQARQVSALTFSSPQISSRRSLISFGVSRFRLNCRHRDNTVTGSFCGSVVASRNLT